MPNFVVSHWTHVWEYLVLPFVVVPFLTAGIKIFAKFKRTIDGEDCAVGFDPMFALVAAIVCFAATIFKETATHCQLAQP